MRKNRKLKRARLNDEPRRLSLRPKSVANSIDPLHLIKKRPLAKLLGISPWTLDRLWKSDRFPPPIRLSDQCICWRYSTVQEFLASREGGRDDR